jgi:hypothetical protein
MTRQLPVRFASALILGFCFDQSSTESSCATALFARLQQNGTWLVPTLSVPHACASIGDAAFYGDGRLQYADAQTPMVESTTHRHIDIPAESRKRNFRMKLRITRAAHDAGYGCSPVPRAAASPICITALGCTTSLLCWAMLA